MSLRLLMDVHVKVSVTEGLRVRGVDVLTAQEDGNGELEDPLLLDRAGELGRVLFTQDKDFIVIAADRQASGRHFSGIIFAEQLRVTIGQCIEELEFMAKLLDPGEMIDVLTRIPMR